MPSVKRFDVWCQWACADVVSCACNISNSSEQFRSVFLHKCVAIKSYSFKYSWCIKCCTYRVHRAHLGLCLHFFSHKLNEKDSDKTWGWKFICGITSGQKKCQGGGLFNDEKKSLLKQKHVRWTHRCTAEVMQFDERASTLGYVTEKHFAGAGRLVAVTIYYTQPANHTANAFSFCGIIEFDVSLCIHVIIIIIIIIIQMNKNRTWWTQKCRSNSLRFVPANFELQWLFIGRELLPFAKLIFYVRWIWKMKSMRKVKK